jgi:hypothetical protein
MVRARGQPSFSHDSIQNQQFPKLLGLPFHETLLHHSPGSSHKHTLPS